MIRPYIHVAIAESSQIILEGLKHILDRSGLFTKIYTAGTVDELLQTAQRCPLDLIILNPALLQQERDLNVVIRKHHPEILLVALIYSYFDPRMLAGFDSQIPIHQQPADIVDELQKLLNKKNEIDAPSRHSLSEREIDVLKLLVGGASNKEIAEKLFISVHTVISHRKNISVKTGIKTLSGLTIYAVLKNLVNLETYN